MYHSFCVCVNRVSVIIGGKLAVLQSFVNIGSTGAEAVDTTILSDMVTNGACV